MSGSSHSSKKRGRERNLPELQRIISAKVTQRRLDHNQTIFWAVKKVVEDGYFEVCISDLPLSHWFISHVQ